MKKNDKNPPKQDEMVTDFGERKVNTQRSSKTVVIPKIALKNCGFDLDDDDARVNISLVKRGDEKFIKISPITETVDDLDENFDHERSKIRSS